MWNFNSHLTSVLVRDSFKLLCLSEGKTEIKAWCDKVCEGLECDKISAEWTTCCGVMLWVKKKKISEKKVRAKDCGNVAMACASLIIP